VKIIKDLKIKKQSAEHRKFIKQQVFRNPYIWIIAVSNLFVYVLRFAILDWGSTLLKEWKSMHLVHAGWMVAAFEISGAMGIIFVDGLRINILVAKSLVFVQLLWLLHLFYVFILEHD
jgi:sugar phosphate permease